MAIKPPGKFFGRFPNPIPTGFLIPRKRDTITKIPIIVYRKRRNELIEMS